MPEWRLLIRLHLHSTGPILSLQQSMLFEELRVWFFSGITRTSSEMYMKTSSAVVVCWEKVQREHDRGEAGALQPAPVVVVMNVLES
jgi:hypothetical protein